MNKLKAGSILAILTLVGFGCNRVGPKTGATTSAANSLYLENLSLDNQKALNEGRFQLIAGYLYLLDRNPKTHFLAKLNGGSYMVLTGVLRNPGGMLYLVGGGKDKALTEKDRLRVIELAKSSGVEVLENGRIPYRFGPDGRTPEVMKTIAEYSPEEYAKIVPMEVEMTFKSSKAAKSAIDYIDQKVYSVKATGTNLSISFKAPVGAATDERQAFDSLARRFEGKVEWLSATTEYESTGPT